MTMKNKICTECNAVNGVRATYCRKCNASLDHVAITETVEAKSNQAFKTAPKPGNRPSMPAPKLKEDIPLPERPAKPRIIYWPFIVSLVSMFLMLALIFTFVIFGGEDEGAASSGSVSGVNGSASPATTQTTETTIAVTDISEVIIGDIAEQTYTGEPLTIPFSISYNDQTLTEDVDYTVTYTDNCAPGTAHAYFEGNGVEYVGSFEATFTIKTGDPVCDDPANLSVVYFSMRISGQMLGHNPDLESLIEQVNGLINGDITGSQLVTDITFSDEALARNLSDEEFVAAVYRGILAREPDEEGLAYNTDLLGGGMSREDLVNSIITAEGGEFENLCLSTGVQP